MKKRLESQSRRNFLALAGTATCGFLLAPGCALFEDDEMVLGTLDELAENDFLVREFNGKLVLANHLEGEIVVFSLICRHKKCTVKWKPEVEQFQCPCHDGVYDARGYVVDGPPPGPLYRFKHKVRGDTLVVLNERFLER